MDKVAAAIEQRLESLQSQEDNKSQPEQARRLLTSPSIDSMVDVASPGTATPEIREGWQPPESSPETGFISTAAYEAGPSPFKDPAFQAVDEAVIVGPSRTYHGLTRGGAARQHAAANALERMDPVGKWQEHRTLLILWLVTALVTLAASLRWLQIGMWAGVLGIVGASFSVCNCFSGRKLPLNLQVTRIFAVIVSALSVFAAVVFFFLLIRLPCPTRGPARGRCVLFRSALVLTGLWHFFHGLVAGLVSAKASQVLSALEPLLTRRVVVVQTSKSQSSVV